MANPKKQILLTNDDGIQSPGLWAAAEALSPLGYVTVAAPREQSSGTGRSLPTTSDGRIRPSKLTVKGKEWTVYDVGGTPAQAVLHAVLEIMPERPHLVVSGINYGENLGSGVTVSGTVGAALEAASLGIPAIAISLETSEEHYFSYSTEIDFSTAGFFLHQFAGVLLERQMPPDFDLLKVDVPAAATPETPWVITRQAKHRYFEPVRPARQTWDEPGMVGYRLSVDPKDVTPDSDIYAIRVRHVVSVTPLSLDMTARVDFGEMDHLFRDGS